MDSTKEQQTDAAAVATLGQALLFSPDIERAVEAEEAKGNYTAARLRAKRPEAYAAIVDHLGAGVGMLRIAALLGVHHLTVAAVRDAEPEQIDIARGKTVSDLRHVARLQIERLKEHPECVPFNVAGMLIDQVIRNAELLDGRATSRVESVERVDIHGDWGAILESLPPDEPKQLRGDQVRELLPGGIGLDGGEISGVRPASAAADPVPREAGSDAQSLVSEPLHEESSRSDTVSATDSGCDGGESGADRQEGAGGVSPPAGGRSTSIHSNTIGFSGSGSDRSEDAP